ncbi:alkaline phosphatase isozyme conversion aminopeptidase [Salmonella enterica subsp. enterica]|uniref:Alkaline phosphatase isozyme conversion aminopeptidase n=1 Tax=Salmonella enterica I TaxID=59201 RepID=A0A379WN82_SALET|nr:alkaline phosphatase isozyme conversion aminopeptidase [Salmonella enterica subsp. enterica]
MSDAEKKNTLLVINLDNLIVGDKLYFNSGKNTPEAGAYTDPAIGHLAIARRYGIAANTKSGTQSILPQRNGLL